MTLLEFETEMQPIIKVFHERNYPTERKAMIFKALSPLTAGQFKSVVNHLTSTARMAPMPSDFKEACSGFFAGIANENRAKIDAQISNLPLCEDCGNEGMIMMHSNCPMKYKYAFKCGCKAGLLRNYKMPFFTLEKWPDLVPAKRRF